jgi:putative copper export protein/mono/diheme cytochrome c family protein
MSLQDMLLLVSRAIVLVLESGIFGTLAVSALAGRTIGRRMVRAMFGMLLIALPVWLILQSAQMADRSSISALPSAVILVLQESWVGHLAIARAATWTLAWLVLRGGTRGGWPRHWALLPAGIGLALHAGAGHAVATGNNLQFLSVLAHVIAAASWIGGLPALWLALDGPNPAQLVGRYTWYGLGCVIAVVLTGALQALELAGGPLGLIGTVYGHVILIKIALFAILLILALRHRFTFAPSLPRSLPALRRSVLLEVMIGVGVLCAASLLSAIPPGAHDQPTWPFAYRISFELLDDTVLRGEVFDAARALGGAALLLLLAVLSRRVRWFAVAAAMGITWFAIPHLDLLLAPTQPTYYWQSTSGFTPASIAAGKATYQQHCANCHGLSGVGDGPLGVGLRIAPTDLTAPHLWNHPDGELYWWITHGINAPDGTLAMPGAGTSLDDDTVWALIDFLHANNPNKPDDVTLGASHLHH